MPTELKDSLLILEKAVTYWKCFQPHLMALIELWLLMWLKALGNVQLVTLCYEVSLFLLY